ncbi:hypothetical protein Ddye_028855 [Dipteronia dyeriana]|uniref:Uncharacterized protein n=1 Tax=Dipteronia dyeriana TaxID=168575 RepID=A0AAD9TE31_9ROSI|nr:hypothetical protein Ddye_028855 [Dipteronia dyeriana]
MGCAASIPDKSSGRSGGLNNLENGGAPDAKNLRVKLVLLGDSGVGKSCIVLRFVRGQFDPTSKVTVGASFLSQTIALQDSTTVKFEIWDTAGQERYAALAPLYYRGAAVAVIVYDITSPESFTKAQYWVKELQKHGSPDIVMALVGNKADLQDSREVPAQVSVKSVNVLICFMSVHFHLFSGLNRYICKIVIGSSMILHFMLYFEGRD